jgi:streptogramin lyase
MLRGFHPLVGIFAFLVVPVAARPAEMVYPLGVAADKDGIIYVADRQLPGIWKIEDGQAEIFFQAEKKFRTPLNAVWSVAVDKDGRLLAGDSATRQVYRFQDGKPVPLLPGVGIGIPIDVDVNQAGEIVVADQEALRIRKVPAAGGEPEEVAVVPGLRRLFIDSEDRIWAVTGGREPLVRVKPDGIIEPVVKEPAFEFPHDVVVLDGTAYVSDNYAHAIWRVDADGQAEKWISGEPLIGPVGLGHRDGKLLIADPKAKAVFEAAPDGELHRVP